MLYPFTPHVHAPYTHASNTQVCHQSYASAQSLSKHDNTIAGLIEKNPNEENINLANDNE